MGVEELDKAHLSKVSQRKAFHENICPVLRPSVDLGICEDDLVSLVPALDINNNELTPAVMISVVGKCCRQRRHLAFFGSFLHVDVASIVVPFQKLS